MTHSPAPVLILGAGINGCALARELLLNGVPVILVDRGDIASGATAYSSRLIHGGLRYLEYGELDLVRESLAERTRLLRLAAHFVRPLQLFIPISNRFGGVRLSATRFLRFPRGGGAAARGLWLVRTGLWLYDTYARDPSLPKHRVYRNGDPRAIAVDPDQYPWLCAYHDAQIAMPERFTIALLEDGRRLAEQQGIEFRVLTYHQARRDGSTVQISPDSDSAHSHPSSAASEASAAALLTLRPAVIVNATGAWVDQTLQRLRVSSRRLMGGTKGSHFFTRHRRLTERLSGRALYGEAEDGRPAFVLPLSGGALVGTTDLPYEGDPAEAVASEQELQYLLRLVNQMLPDVALQRSDIQWHYSGVRPLPYMGGGTPAAVTRRHWLERQETEGLVIHSLIGGKLTTSRALAEETTAAIMSDLGLPVSRTSRDRCIPSSQDYPRSDDQRDRIVRKLATQFRWPAEAVEAVWSLCGTETRSVLTSLGSPSAETIRGTRFPRAFVRWIIQHEWVSRLDDLVERRLMLLYDPLLTEASLRELAELLVEEGRLDAAEIAGEVARVRLRLINHFGNRIAP